MPTKKHTAAQQTAEALITLSRDYMQSRCLEREFRALLASTMLFVGMGLSLASLAWGLVLAGNAAQAGMHSAAPVDTAMIPALLLSGGVLLLIVLWQSARVFGLVQFGMRFRVRRIRG